MRPHISEETAEKVNARVDDSLRVPAERLNFDERLELLIEDYDKVRRQLEMQATGDGAVNPQDVNPNQL